MQKWKKLENNAAKEFKGKRNRGSGNRWYNPGDIRLDNFLIEAKQTERKSYSISKRTWDKIYEEALFSYRLPVMLLQIQDLELVVLSKEDFQKLIPIKSRDSRSR